MKQKNSKKTVRKKSSQPGCLFWIALILLVITLFAVKHKNIRETLSSTGFMDYLPGKEKAKDNNDKLPESNNVEIERITKKETEVIKPDESQPAAVKEKEVQIIDAPKSTVNEVKEAKEKTSQQDTEVKTAAAIPPFKVRDSILYFIVINEDGSTMLKKTNRSIRYTDSPLTSTINSLLSGVSSSELNNNYISLIPENTRVNRLWIADGTAYMDFNENFLFNSFGREGYIGQLKQVVYTATEFSSVKRVQFLIDGKNRSYLGSEGIFIGNPLSRGSFNQ